MLWHDSGSARRLINEQPVLADQGPTGPNVGICPFHGFLDIPVNLSRNVIGVNLTGAYHVARAAARQMVSQGTGGAIVATSSNRALVGDAMQTHYTSTRAGVHLPMQSAAIALDPHRIRCIR